MAINEYNNSQAYNAENKDKVLYNNICYQCIKDTYGGHPPDANNEPEYWYPYYTSNYYYQVEDTVLYENNLYECIQDTIGHTPSENSDYWFLYTSDEDIQISDTNENEYIAAEKELFDLDNIDKEDVIYNSEWEYDTGDICFYNNEYYICLQDNVINITPGSNSLVWQKQTEVTITPSIENSNYDSAIAYTVGQIVYYNQQYYICIQDYPNPYPNPYTIPPFDTDYWSPQQESNLADNYDGTISYTVDDIVYYDGNYYVCILDYPDPYNYEVEHILPTNITYWNLITQEQQSTEEVPENEDFITQFSSFETISNKTQTLSAYSTADEYPSAKCVYDELTNLLAANDAMVFKGTIGNIEDNPTVTTLPNVHESGWSYKVVTAGIYADETCEVGDMIICIKDRNSANNADWAIVQTNIDGAVIGPTGSVIGHVPIFNSSNGKSIEDSSYTIATSVPSGAVFTDTTYAFLGGDGSFSVTPSNGSTETISIGKPPIAIKAETVDVTDTTPTSAKSYYPVYVTGRSNDQILRANADLYYYDAGTYSYLNVGSNSTQGGLTLHCNNGNYANITPTTLSAIRTFTLPNKTGTIALTSDLTSKAPLESPALTGVPTAPTANLNTNTTQLATTEFVNNQINSLDVSAITGTAGQTITSISETDGKLSATYSNISITENQISDLGDYIVKTYEDFPNSWNDMATNEYTFQNFLDEVDSSDEAQVGHSFLGRLACSDLATPGNAVVEILQGTVALNKIIHIIFYGDNLIPAKQELIYHSVDGSDSGWF